MRIRSVHVNPASVGVISALVGKELGERNLCFDSLESRLNRDTEEKEMVAVCRLPSPEELAYDREVGTMERRRNDTDRTDSCLLKTSLSTAGMS